VIDGPETLGAIVAEFVPQLDPEIRRRCQVLRTTKTEDRAPIDRQLRIEVYKRDNFSCVWCGHNGRLELDHITPWSAGGPDTFDNLRTLCHWCNEYRSNYANAVDDACRRLPSGFQCVDCNYRDIAGDPELTAIYCRTCQQNAAGLPGSVAVPRSRDEEREWEWETA
jgi:hypothetical protein